MEHGRDTAPTIPSSPVLTLELNATPQEVMRAVGELEQFCQANDVPEKTIFGLALALEECGSNIVTHALKQDPEQKFKVTFERTPESLNIELRDPGPEFDLTHAAPRPLTEDEDRPEGGWGIHLVRHYTEGITYRRENGVNVLRLTKRLINP